MDTNYSSVLKEWSLRAFTEAIKPIGSRYLLSIRNLIGQLFANFGNLCRFFELRPS